MAVKMHGDTEKCWRRESAPGGKRKEGNRGKKHKMEAGRDLQANWQSTGNTTDGFYPKTMQRIVGSICIITTIYLYGNHEVEVHVYGRVYVLLALLLLLTIVRGTLCVDRLSDIAELTHEFPYINELSWQTSQAQQILIIISILMINSLHFTLLVKTGWKA